MAPLPDHRPHTLSLGPLESELLHLLWSMGSATAKQLHEQILSDPDRELTYPSVMTVLRRLEKKGWLRPEKVNRALWWHPRLSQQDAQMMEAHQRLQKFLSVGNPDIVAAFADSLDPASLDRLEAIAQRLQAIRKSREEEQ